MDARHRFFRDLENPNDGPAGDSSPNSFPAEPVFGSPEAVKRAAEFTRGPWTAAGLCRVTYDDGTQESLRGIASRSAGVHALALTTDADARLIAAAPDLLDALEVGLRWSEADGSPDDDEMVTAEERAFREMARAALRKAGRLA